MLCTIALFANFASAAIQTHTIDTVRIDRDYPAMSGPEIEKFLKLEGVGPKDDFWVTGIRLKVEREGRATSRYLCHSRLIVAPAGKTTKDGYEQGKPGYGRSAGQTPVLAVSQGQPEVFMPKGFGLRVDRWDGGRDLQFGIQLQNSDHKGPAFPLEIKTEIEYWTDQEARAKKLKPLFVWRMLATHNGHGHWDVPPGRHEYRTRFRPSAEGIREVKIHYIRLHLHAYAESLELFDLTEQRSLWTGRATTDFSTDTVKTIDHYSSESGLPLKIGHEYEVRAVYNNSKTVPIEAMAYMSLFSSAEVRIR